VVVHYQNVHHDLVNMYMAKDLGIFLLKYRSFHRTCIVMAKLAQHSQKFHINKPAQAATRVRLHTCTHTWWRIFTVLVT
jgi:hypothetical protein